MTETQHEAAAERALGNRRSTKRNVALATVDGQRFLTFKDVAAITSFHVATLYRKVADGEFPQPVRLSENRVGFRESDVAKWMAERQERKPAKRPAKPRLGSSPLRRLAAPAA
jgi:prophage regulatory protein